MHGSAYAALKVEAAPGFQQELDHVVVPRADCKVDDWIFIELSIQNFLVLAQHVHQHLQITADDDQFQLTEGGFEQFCTDLRVTLVQGYPSTPIPQHLRHLNLIGLSHLAEVSQLAGIQFQWIRVLFHR